MGYLSDLSPRLQFVAGSYTVAGAISGYQEGGSLRAAVAGAFAGLGAFVVLCEVDSYVNKLEARRILDGEYRMVAHQLRAEGKPVPGWLGCTCSGAAPSIDYDHDSSVDHSVYYECEESESLDYDDLEPMEFEGDDDGEASAKGSADGSASADGIEEAASP